VSNLRDQKRHKVRLRFSLGALFIAVAIVAAVMAYVRTLRRETLETGGRFTTGGGALSLEEATAAAKSLEALLFNEGYSRSAEPSLPRLKVEGELTWLRRGFGGSGEMYVAIDYGPAPTDAHELGVMVVGKKIEGPFANPRPIENESDRIGKVVRNWWKQEVESGRVYRSDP
jgi:hypothetical protein